MQILKCFEANLDESGRYEITPNQLYFPGDFAPSTYNQTNGVYYKNFSKIEGNVTYIVYALGESTQEKIDLIEQAWNNYCA